MTVAALAPTPLPGVGEVHVWEMARASSAEIDSLAWLLSPEELARADRLRASSVRERFVYYRATVRMVLAQYLQVDPRDVPLAATALGKPYLACETSLAL